MSVRTLNNDEVLPLDLNDCKDEASMNRQVARLRESLERLGFLVLKKHPIDMSLVKTAYKLGLDFFHLPEEEKAKVSYKLIDQKKYGNVGYYGHEIEKAVSAKQPDIKEFIHVGQLIEEGHEMADSYPINLWPQRPEGFRDVYTRIYRSFEACGAQLMDMIGRAYGLDLDYLRNLLACGNSILRMLHYPAVSEQKDSLGAMRAAPHTGINLLGLLPPSSHPGLQFYTPSGEWVCMGEGYEDCLSINIGEMMAFMIPSIQSTLHQVVNSQGGEGSGSRYSMVLFLHPNSSQELVPVDEAGTKLKQNAILSGKWLSDRLKKINIAN